MKKLALATLLGLTLSFSAQAQTAKPAEKSTSTQIQEENKMTTLTGNSKIVADYLDAVFNQKDLAVVEGYWAGKMIQHNPAMPNGLDVLRGFITSPDAKEMSYERGIIMEQGDFVMVHGKYNNWAGKTMLAVDIFRLENGKVVEHWDVMQEEVPADKSVNGNAMFPVK